MPGCIIDGVLKPTIGVGALETYRIPLCLTAGLAPQAVPHLYGGGGCPPAPLPPGGIGWPPG